MNNTKLNEITKDFRQLLNNPAINFTKKYHLTGIHADELRNEFLKIFKIGLIIGDGLSELEYENYKTIFLAGLEANENMKETFKELKNEQKNI